MSSSLYNPIFTNQYGSQKLHNLINHNRDKYTGKICSFDELINMIERGEEINAGIDIILDKNEWQEIKDNIKETYYHKKTGYYMIVEYDSNFEMWCRVFIKKSGSDDTIWLTDIMDDMLWDLEDNTDAEVEVTLFQEYV